MRVLGSVCLAVALLFHLGCDGSPAIPNVEDIPAVVEGGPDTSGMAKAPRPSEDKITDPKVTFIGRHKGEKPDPRYGTFASSTASLKMPGGKLEKAQIGIHTATLMVDAQKSGLDEEGAQKLRTHLASADFFNINQFPTIEFDSTSVEYADDGTAIIHGNFKFLGETHSLSVPLTFPDENTIEAKFKLDRTKYGMNFGLDQIEEEVELIVVLDLTHG